MLDVLRAIDPEIASAIVREEQRQVVNIELIASENYASAAVMAAQGSVLTNKYAEGLPGKRYYGGCEFVDVAEELAQDRVKKLFGAEYANVQPHSGAQANMATYFAFLKPGDTLMGMNLAHGGHLTHGAAANFSGKFFSIVDYSVDKDSERIDYDDLRSRALAARPKMIVAGASAYPRIIDFERFRAVADEVGALFMVDMAHIAGLVAAGLHPNPVQYADIVTSTTHKTLRGPRGGLILCREEFAKKIDKMVFPGIQGGPLMHVIAAKAVAFKEALTPEFRTYQQQVVRNASALADQLASDGLRIVSGGTDNHLMLVDLNPIEVTGKDAEEALDAVGITVNKNAIPFDEKPRMITSGLRLGSPAVTSRGFNEDEMRLVGRLIARVLKNIGDKKESAAVREEVASLTSRFPVPGIEAPVRV